MQQQLAQVGIELQVQALEVGQRTERRVGCLARPATRQGAHVLHGLVVVDRLKPTGRCARCSPRAMAAQAHRTTSFYKNRGWCDGNVAKALSLRWTTRKKAALYKTAQEQLSKDTTARSAGRPSRDLLGAPSACRACT